MSTTLYLDGKRLDLTDQDYLSAGGQARVYRRDDTVFKVFDLDPGPRFEQKLRDLSVLGSCASIVAPQKVLKTKRGQVAGYSMVYVPDAIPLPKLFTTGFQSRAQVTTDTITGLVKTMMESIRFIHSQGFLLVDGNEFNYLVSRDFQRVFFIDVDSYQTPGFPASVLMPSIRDWLSPQFHEGSDWFAFAVVATQLYLGIHPFRGTWKGHPGVRSLEERVVQRLSVFHPDVAVPTTTRAPGLVPTNFREWLVRVFQDGERTGPPVPDPTTSTKRAHHPRPTGGSLKIEPLSSWPEGLAREPMLRREEGGGPNLDIPGDPVVMGGRLYVIQKGVLIETATFSIGAQTRLIERQRWRLSRHAYQVLDGMIAVDHLGARFLVVPFSAGACGQYRVPSLDGHLIVDGRFHERVAVILSSRAGQNYRTEFHWDKNLESFQWEEQIGVEDFPELNFVVLKGTTLVSLGATLDLQLVGQPGRRRIEVGDLQGGSLATVGDRLFWVLEGRAYRLTLGA